MIKKLLTTLIFITLIIGIGVGIRYWSKWADRIQTVPPESITEIDWDLLSELDYKSGKVPPQLKKIHNTYVKIPGFIVPLSDDYRILDEFLLVPNAQACIHVPPPPPNLIIHVRLKNPLPLEQVENPSWIQGKLTIEETKSIYGSASYKMEADLVTAY